MKTLKVIFKIGGMLICLILFSCIIYEKYFHEKDPSSMNVLLVIILYMQFFLSDDIHGNNKTT